MLGLIRDRGGDKDLRRFAIACCRRIWPLIQDDRSRRAVEMAELDIKERLAAEERLAVARGAADALAEASAKLDIRSNGHLYHAALAAALCLHADGVPLRTRSGDERRIDVDSEYFVELAHAAGLRLVERLGVLCGQETFLFAGSQVSNDCFAQGGWSTAIAGGRPSAALWSSAHCNGV